MTGRALMVFAAGRGTRMGALTAERPKPLIPVAGRPLIDHALDLSGGAGRIVVNVHHKAQMLRDHLAGRPRVTISDESDLLRETGGGLRHALPLLGAGPVATLNSDAVWRGPNPLPLLEAAWDPSRMEALLLLVPPERAGGHAGPGDFARDGDGRLSRGPGHVPTGVYSGAQILRTEGLRDIPGEVFSLNLLWDRMAARAGLFGLVYPGDWCDVGRPENIPLAEALLR